MSRILIVDDEVDFLEIVKMNLEDEHYDVKTLISGENILNEVQKFSPDLILLDMLMPKIKGIEICEILIQDPVVGKIPIIMLTAVDKDAEKADAYDAGVFDYLIKPIGKKDLIEKMKRALGT